MADRTGHHINAEGRFQSDLYNGTVPGKPAIGVDKIVLSFHDRRAHTALTWFAYFCQNTDPDLAGDIRARLRSIRWPSRNTEKPQTISDRENKVLRALRNLDPGYAMFFWAIAKRTKMDKKKVRLACRSLARKGLAVHIGGLVSEDDGRLAGSGYGITEGGRAALSLEGENG